MYTSIHSLPDTETIPYQSVSLCVCSCIGSQRTCRDTSVQLTWFLVFFCSVKRVFPVCVDPFTLSWYTDQCSVKFSLQLYYSDLNLDLLLRYLGKWVLISGIIAFLYINDIENSVRVSLWWIFIEITAQWKWEANAHMNQKSSMNILVMCWMC